MLVVYDPTLNVGITGKNKKDLIPRLANGDVMPGLTQPMEGSAPGAYTFSVNRRTDTPSLRLRAERQSS